MRPVAAVILAAGRGKRFKSALPKVLHELNGVPMVHHVLSAISSVNGLQRIVLVVGGDDDAVAQAVGRSFPSVEFVEQPDQLGTGDAVKRCEPLLARFDGTILIVSGDSPLVRAASLEEVVEHHVKSGAGATLMTARLDDPTGYGRIVRTSGGEFSRVVEEADADAGTRAIDEVSTGVWCFSPGTLFRSLSKVEANNSQGEFYLPDAAFIAGSEGEMIATVMSAEPDEVVGVNDRFQLAEAARRLRMRVIEDLASQGVTFEDPLTTYITEGIRIGADTVIKPNTYLEGATQIGAGCVVGPSTRVADSIVEDGAEVTFSVVIGAHVGPRARVGPFAYLRPGTRLGEGAKAGTFVEVKGSIIGAGSKVPHLSYIGDAEVGRDVNLGAGTITGNYDTETKVKSKTVVEDGAFTGSDTTLVAPVTLGKDAGTGAGSVVTKDVAEGDVVAGVPARFMRKRKPRKEDN